MPSTPSEPPAVLASLPPELSSECVLTGLDLGPPLTAGLVRVALQTRTADVLNCEERRAALQSLYEDQAEKLSGVFSR